MQGPGVFNNIVANTVVVEGANGGFFAYNGPPTIGNLIASLSGAAGVDPYGNTYPQGFAIFGLSGGSVIIDPGANSGVPFIFLYPKGATKLQLPPQVYSGALNAGGSNESEYAVLFSGESLFPGNNNAALQVFSDAADGSSKAFARFVIDGSNIDLNTIMAGNLPINQVSTATFTNANNGAQFMAGFTIPANDAQVGAIYEIETPFNGTFENQTLAFKPYLGNTPITTSNGDTIGSGFFSAGIGFTGNIRLRVQIMSLGSGGTVNYFVDGAIGNAGNRASGINSAATVLNSQSTNSPMDTTIAQTISIASVWGGSTVGQTITARGFKFTRSGP